MRQLRARRIARLRRARLQRLARLARLRRQRAQRRGGRYGRGISKPRYNRRFGKRQQKQSWRKRIGSWIRKWREAREARKIARKQAKKSQPQAPKAQAPKQLPSRPRNPARPSRYPSRNPMRIPIRIPSRYPPRYPSNVRVNPAGGNPAGGKKHHRRGGFWRKVGRLAKKAGKWALGKITGKFTKPISWIKKWRENRRNKKQQQQQSKPQTAQQQKPKVSATDAFEQLRRSCKGALSNGACPGTKQIGNPIVVAGRQFVCCEKFKAPVVVKPIVNPSGAAIPCGTFGRRNGVCRPVSGWITKGARPRLGCPHGHYCSFGILSKKWGY